MKRDTEYLDSSIWYKEEIPDPNQLLAEFFIIADVPDYREDIYHMVRTACSGKYWKKGSPGDLIFLFKNLESVINAAYLMNKQGKKSPLNIEDTDIFNPNLFRGNSSIYKDWDYFPHMLRYDEFMNPYATFRRFFKYQGLSQWKTSLQSLSDYALSRSKIFDELEEFDCLAIYRHLVRLVEAAHLIDVRENTHIDGRIKNRIPRAGIRH